MEKTNKPEIFAVWICSEGSYMMPFLYEVCIASWQILNPDFKVVVYTNNPQLKYNFLSKDATETRLIDDTILEDAKELTRETPIGMKFAHQSDFVRYYILNKYGGMYVDADLFCISPIKELYEECIKENTPVVMAYEDTQRICNAFVANFNENGNPFYADILNNYRNRYVKSSYTFNSIKYPMIIKNKYRDLIRILPFKEGMFYPNWENNTNGDLSLLKQPEMPDSICGYGIHLYNTDIKWKEVRNIIADNLYSNNLDWWVIKHLNNVMDKYMDLLPNIETRDIFQDEHLVDGLTKLYGEDYLKQFRKEK